MKFTAQWGKAPSNSRDRALELVEEGYISAEDLLTAALKYMSTDDVEDMLDCNELSDRFMEDADYA
tara:strand:- start:74 stop:271 length:198 start_codon:yes stop_codon:yes gene_type:complete